MKKIKKAVSLDSKMQKYYQQGTEKERLRSSMHRLEHDRVLMILKKMLPPAPAVVVDVGGAAGIFAFPLAEMGYKVHLIDPIALHIKQAKEQAKLTNIHLASYLVEDARKLSLRDFFADAVLLFGPLYHLVEKSDRIQALKEAHRILKPAGVLLAAGVSRFASLMSRMYKKKIYEKFPEVQRDLSSGIHISDDPEKFTSAYFHYPDELENELNEVSFKQTSLRAIEGPVWEKTTVEQLQQDESNWIKLLTLIEKIESEPSLIGASAHMMAIGFK